MKVRLVLDAGNREWILGKFAERLRDNLPAWGVAAEIAEEPSAEADINHWMFYGHAWGFFFQQARRRLTPSTVTVTHLDDPIKVRMVREVLEQVADVAVCLSRMTVDELAARDLPRERLCYITPGHDGAVSPRRIVIGITSRAYPDGRKREHLLVELAQSLRLEAFHFEIIGSGWEKVIPALEGAGATVSYYPGTGDYKRDYAHTLERLRTFDYYLYMGLDEGSMGLLDALAAGVQTIVTRQGFHLDIPGAITHGFVDGAELNGIFRELVRRREALLDSARRLTWSEYARQHAVAWKLLAQGRAGEISRALHPDDSAEGAAPLTRRARFRLRYWLNARTSDFRDLYLERRRWQIRAALSRAKRALLGQ
jgi:hypothetical protein